jgi:hypothetical protein
MKIQNTEVYGLGESIVASGYPMMVQTEEFWYEMCNDIPEVLYQEKDLKRAKALGGTNIGEGHDNYLNGIVVQFDLTFTNKAWVELQRYHFIDFVSSQSTMHRISEFSLKEQYNEYVDDRIINIMEELKDEYNKTKDKKDYLKLLYSNPCGFELTARMTTNYRQLKTMYIQRHNHRLPEWREFCEWILRLPKFKELTRIGGELNEET